MVLVVLAAVIGVPGGGEGTAPPAEATSGQVEDRVLGPPGVLAPDGRWTVTLLTGEIVEVWSDGDGRVSATVREHVGAMRSLRKPNGDLFVMPISVTPLLAGVLDVELFNVTGLIRQHYDDASTGLVPLIVQHEPGVEVQSTFTTADAAEPLPSIGAVATEVPKADARATGALLAGLGGDVDVHTDSVEGITRIWLDRRVTTQSVGESPTATGQPTLPLDGNLTQIGADDAWATGLTGEGVQVAVLDTGIDARHPDLAGRVIAVENFSQSPDTVDRFGHGTHVASIVAGTGAAAEGGRRGVAPDADLLVGKVLGDDGFGATSDVIAGMEWAAPQADIVNMSLGDSFPSDGSDPVSMALDQLSQQFGTLFVVAAGNQGPASQTIGTPAAADAALTVGAVDAADVLADFSSRGPLVTSNELKPELVAPGVDIAAARAAGTALGQPVDADYTMVSGTSMASPHVAGAAAVLAQLHPDWSGDQLKSALIGSADPLDADSFDVGAGRVDIGDGIATVVRADRDVIDVSLNDPRTEPRTEQLGWTNIDDQPHTLSLHATLVDRRGDPVDVMSIEPAHLTLPAGATGSSTVRIEVGDLDAGLYSGAVCADVSGIDDEAVCTPLGVHAEPEMANLTIEATPPPGSANEDPFGALSIVNLDDYATFNLVGGLYRGASVSLSVPVGRYAVVGDVSTAGLDTQIVAQVGDPDVMVTGETTVAFDGSRSVPFTPVVTGVENARPVATNVGSIITPRAGTAGFGIESDVFSWYPEPPVHVTAMEGDPDTFAVRQPVVRLQAPHITARIGADAIEVTTVALARAPAVDEHTLLPVDVGDGRDLTAARGQLAVVQLPADREERVAITQRARDAGVALVAFVDDTRSILTLTTAFSFTGPWADVPVMAAAGQSALGLRAAAAAGRDVTVTVTASPYVYDVVLPATDPLDPRPVISRRVQARLATIDERFHHDATGPGASGDRRRALSVSLMELDSVGQLPGERTSYLTPAVTWQSRVFGEGYVRNIFGQLQLGQTAVSLTPETRYDAGSRQTLEWLRRPMPPGPVGAPPSRNFCQPSPVRRTADALLVSLAAYQDSPDRFTCNIPLDAALTLERNGAVIGTVTSPEATFTLPVERGTYRLSYEETGLSPYPHRSTTRWSFVSAGDVGAGFVLIPLLVVDYDLALDNSNRPTGRTATFTVRQVTGTDRQPIRSMRAWISTDDGTTWSEAPIRRLERGTFRVTLPHVATGTSVSLRVDARDAAGSRIEQTLHDAYTG